jgi:hypothetical protein
VAAYDVAQIKEIADMVNDIVSLLRVCHSSAGAEAVCSRVQIDWEESGRQNGKVCVRPGVDSALDELRRKYNGLGSLLVSPSPIQTFVRHRF